MFRLNRVFLRNLSNELTYDTRRATINAGLYPPIGVARKRLSPTTSVVSIADFRRQFESYDFSTLPQKKNETPTILEGQIASIRRAGRAMYFVDIVQSAQKVQIVASNKTMEMSKEDFDEIFLYFKPGDVVGCHGYASRTQVGELSLKLDKPMTMLVPRVRGVPNKVVDKGLINSHRVMNYLVNPETQIPVRTKSWVAQLIRGFLLLRGFLEVNTPIMAGSGTGANARPFTTVLKGHDDEMSLRVAPELWLKKMVIGGFEKVFEIGASFRNEGVDATHNPEFTTCEFYQTYLRLEDLVALTEQMFATVYEDLSRELPDIAHLRPLSEPFLKYEFIPELEARTGVEFPLVLDSSSLVEYHRAVGLEVPQNESPANLLDNLSATYLESISMEHPNTPVVIYNQPAALLPLAKSTQVKYRENTYDISLRFELFINGKEYVNSYEEENLPAAQHEKFLEQQRARTDFADDEMLVPDWEYVRTMEYGLPPTGGWGCGIDRLAMLFSGSDRIDNVLPFGNVRDVMKQ